MNKEVWTKSRRVQDARHLSNPTRNERSECRVGYAMGMRSCVSETHYYFVPLARGTGWCHQHGNRTKTSHAQ